MSKKVFNTGVTLVELLIVVVILAAISAVAIPRISQSAQDAKYNNCEVNIDLINSAIEMYNADNGAYPASLTDIIGTDNSSTQYFPDGPPNCPLGGDYTMNSKHRVICSH